MSSPEHEHRVQYNLDLESRLSTYCNKSGESNSEIRNYFKVKADPYNMKSPYDAHNIYCKLMDEFLTDNNC